MFKKPDEVEVEIAGVDPWDILGHIVLPYRTVTFVEIDDGVQQYVKGQTWGALGTDGFYKEGTYRWIALRAMIDAEMDGVHRHNKWWQNATQSALAKIKKGKALKENLYTKYANKYLGA